MRAIAALVAAWLVLGDAAAQDSWSSAVGAFHRVCTDAAAVSTAPDLDGLISRLNAEAAATGTSVEQRDGGRQALSLANDAEIVVAPIQTRSESAWICELRLPSVEVRRAWRTWIDISGASRSHSNSETVIHGDDIRSALMVMRSERFRGGALLGAAPLGAAPQLNAQLNAPSTMPPMTATATAALQPTSFTCPIEIRQTNRVDPGPPAFPSSALEQGVQGWAIVAFGLDASGEPANVRVLESAPGNTFAEPARRLARRMTFSGVAESCTLHMVLRFRQ